MQLLSDNVGVGFVVSSSCRAHALPKVETDPSKLLKVNRNCTQVQSRVQACWLSRPCFVYLWTLSDKTMMMVSLTSGQGMDGHTNYQITGPDLCRHLVSFDFVKNLYNLLSPYILAQPEWVVKGSFILVWLMCHKQMSGLWLFVGHPRSNSRGVISYSDSGLFWQF